MGRAKSNKEIIKQLEDPPAITEFLPPYVNDYVASLDNEYVNLDEPTLLDKIRKDLSKPNWQPPIQVDNLRKNLWDSYEIAHRYNTTIPAEQIYKDVCEQGVFRSYLQNQSTLAWILCRPLTYEKIIDGLLDRGYRRFEEILASPLKDKMGNVDAKMVDMMFKIVTAMDLRKRGGYVQRSEQMIRQQIEHTSGGAKEVKSQVADIDQRIKELEAKIASTTKQLPSPVVDAELVGLPDGQKG